MTATPFDSPVWRGTFHNAEMAPLFTDTAALRADLLVMGTLAITQAKAGLIPEVSAQAIHRAAMEIQIDPAALAPMVSETGEPVIALVAQFQAEMKAPEHAKWVHHQSDPVLTGATGLALRLRQSLKILSSRLDEVSTPLVFAYHADEETRKGLAAGLNLADSKGADQSEAISTIADWIAQRAEKQEPRSDVDSALKHQISALNSTLQTAPPNCTHLIIPMTLPQMVLGLGKLLE